MFKKFTLIAKEKQQKKPNLWFFLYLVFIGAIALGATVWSEYLTPIALGILFLGLLIIILISG